MYFADPNKKYVILDIEGNSASKEDERKITQFSAIVVEGESIKEVNIMNRNVNFINSYVSKMTKISLQKCKDEGVSERHLIKEIHELLSSADLIYAYGCDFDKNILKLMFRKYEYEQPKVKWVDVIKDVEKYLCPSKLKLSIAASEYGFSESNFHNALVDCYATLHLMKAIEKMQETFND